MPVSEDGVPYGSIDANELDSIDPKTDEAKAAVDALKAERDAGQKQVAADEQRLAEGNKAPGAEPAEDEKSEDAKSAEQSGAQKSSGRKASEK